MKTKPLLSIASALIALGAGVAQAQPSKFPKNASAMERIDAVRNTNPGGRWVLHCVPRRPKTCRMVWVIH
jgi:hypothetical protein